MSRGGDEPREGVAPIRDGPPACARVSLGVPAMSSSEPSTSIFRFTVLRERFRACDAGDDWEKEGIVLLHRFLASVGGTGGSRGCSFGWVGE